MTATALNRRNLFRVAGLSFFAPILPSLAQQTNIPPTTSESKDMRYDNYQSIRVLQEQGVAWLTIVNAL